MTGQKDTLIADLLDLPQQVFKGDFVLNLAEGVTDPERTVETYVSTDQLTRCFDDALGFIKDALETRRSKAAYLHGSFGSGKSHFMAILHLLLQQNLAVRSKPELAAVCAKHDWTRNKKFLLVPYHLIGKKSLRAAILGGYVDHVRKLHPGVPAPSVYLDEEIFKNAAQYRKDVGDEKFFQRLSPAGGDSRWGELGKGWTRASYESALKASPGSEDRLRLASDLVEQFFPAYREIAKAKETAFVELDDGLKVISQHAKGLGYDAVVLFLDELILWLASHAADLPFIQREGQSMVKLVEAQSAGWPAPIVSFIARQRDLRELVGETVTGADKLRFADALGHWEERFHKIVLEDRNLPVIAEKRVLKPRSDEARARIDRAFEETKTIRNEVMEVLLTRDADRKMFRQVYPFSPAFIQALVAISSVLQRERTALRILMEMLIGRRETLKLGEIVPVGDLWDAVATGDGNFADLMRVRVEQARSVYTRKFRPLLEEEHGIHSDEDEVRARTDPGVAEKLQLFKNDDRLVKTLLLAAIVPELECLKGLTASRLAALNHGTIRAPLPGREGQIVLGKLKTWRERISEIRLSGDETNPSVTLELSAIDTDVVIDAAKNYDTSGARQRKVKEIVLEAMGISSMDEVLQYRDRPILWRNTRRTARILCANVRELPDESLENKDEGWKVIVDFPFDQEGYTAQHDLDRVASFTASRTGTHTLVWLPSFLSRKTLADLGKLVVLDHLLQGENAFLIHTQSLRATDREVARGLLRNQQAGLRTSIRETLEAAYGIRNAQPNMLDESDDLSDRHFHSLEPGFNLRPPAAGSSLGAALDDLIGQALDRQFPGHPQFEREVRNADLRRVLDACREAAGVDPPRVLVDKKDRLILRAVVNPLELGKVTEDGYLVLGTVWRDHFNRKLAQAQKPHPTAGDLRRWIDEPEPRGLPEEVENLLILVYAEQTNRALYLHGGAAEGTIEKLSNEVELRQARLPSEADWKAARDPAGRLFGLTPGAHATQGQVAKLAAELDAAVKPHLAGCDRLPGLLEQCLRDLKVPAEEIEKALRVITARATQKILKVLAETNGTERIEALARANMATSGTAMGKSMTSAEDNLRVIRDTRWQFFQALLAIPEDRQTQAHIILGDVKKALTSDEYVVSLSEQLRGAEDRAVKLLTPPPPPPPLKDPKPEPAKGWKPMEAIRRTELDSVSLTQETAAIAARLKADPSLRVDVSWSILKKEGKD